MKKEKLANKIARAILYELFSYAEIGPALEKWPENTKVKIEASFTSVILKVIKGDKVAMFNLKQFEKDLRKSKSWPKIKKYRAQLAKREKRDIKKLMKQLKYMREHPSKYVYRMLGNGNFKKELNPLWVDKHA